MAKKLTRPVAVIDNVTSEKPTAETAAANALKFTELMLAANRAISELKIASRLLALPTDGICPILFNDHFYNIALPFAGFDTYQRVLLAARAIPDYDFFEQFLNIAAGVSGKVIVDVGSYTGLHAIVMARSFQSTHIHLFEPQMTLQDALRRTIAANGLTQTSTLHAAIVDEADREMNIGRQRPDRMSETIYLRKAGGKKRSVSIDSLSLENVGIINFDFSASKIPALRGALQTIKNCRPLIATDLTGRDILEINALLVEHAYDMLRVGRNSAIFIPR